MRLPLLALVPALALLALPTEGGDIDWCKIIFCPPPPGTEIPGTMPGQGGQQDGMRGGGGGPSYPQCGLIFPDGSVGACGPPGNTGGARAPEQPKPPSVPVDVYRASAYPAGTIPALGSGTERKGPVRVIRDAQGAVLGLLGGDVGLPMPQGTARDASTLAVPATDPVAADGEFTVQETDVSLAGIGVPFQFTRYYRSGVDFQSALGWGWNHSFGARVVEAAGTYGNPQGCSSPHPDVFLTTERMTTVHFAFATSEGDVDYYVTRTPGSPSILRRERANGGLPWVVEDGNGRIYRFDGTYGTLGSIADYAGHAIHLEWTHEATHATAMLASVPTSVRSTPLAHRLTRAVDTTGRTIYFNYGRQSIEHGGLTYEFEALACLSLNMSCEQPLVTFRTQGALGLDSDASPYVVGGSIDMEIDLVGVALPSGRSSTYRYFNGAATTLEDRDQDASTSEDAELLCSTLCDDKQVSCRNTDICGSFVADEAAKCERLAAPHQPTPWGEWGLYLGRCLGYCMAGSSYRDAFGEAQALAACEAKRADAEKRCQLDPAGCFDYDCQNSYRPECYARLEGLKGKLPECRAGCRSECLSRRGAEAGIRYGSRPALAHNLVKIVDGEGRYVVENRYGEEPGSLSFDKVITQWQPGSVRRLTYYDAQVPERGFEDDRFFPDPRQFQSANICTGKRDRRPARGQAMQRPRFASVIHDAVGRIFTNYYDDNWRLLRSINQPAKLTQDFNYTDGALVAVRHPSGTRECFTNDDQGRPVSVIELPAPGFPGDAAPRETIMEYSRSGLLSMVVTDAGGARPSGRKVLRDSFERVVAIAEQVDATRANWTCYDYADPVQAWPALAMLASGSGAVPSPQPPPERPRGTEVRSSRRGITEFAPISRMFQPSGCRQGLVSRSLATWLGSWIGEILPRRRDALPTTITHPDGSLTRYAELSAGGPGRIELDAAGHDPLVSYALYDERGRWRETGRVVTDGSGRRNVPLVRRTLDTADEVLAEQRFDPGRLAWWETRYAYDLGGHLRSIRDPEADHTIVVNALGDVLAVREQPRAPTTAEARTGCTRYDGNGRIAASVLPEGNLVTYRYHDSGQLAEVVEGFASGLLPWASGCSPVVVPISSSLGSGTSPRESVTTLRYDESGFPSGAVVDGVSVELTVDGFGRIIAERRPERDDPSGTVYRYLVRGYDVHDQVAWEGVFDTPPPGFARPSAPMPGMHAFVEFEYDLLNRLTRETRWRFTATMLSGTADGLHAVSSSQYDDASRTVTQTDPTGTVSILRFDGLGRVVAEEQAVGTPNFSSKTTEYSEGATSVRTLFAPAPTASGELERVASLDLLGRVTSVRESGRQVLAQDFDHRGRTVRRTAAGRGLESFEYDAFGRGVSIRQQAAAAPDLITRLEWDRNDRLKAVIDAGGHATRYGYDGLGRLTSIADDIGIRLYRFVPGTRRVASIVLPSGATRTVGYDPAGRLATMTAAADGSSITRQYTWTATDQLASASQVGDPASVVTLRYDSIGRVMSEAKGALGISYDYGDRRRELSVSMAGVGTVHINEAFDELGRPTAVSLDGASIATISYERGARKAIAYANGALSTFGYDSIGRLSDATLTSGGALIARVTDTFGPDGVARLRQRTFASAVPTTDVFTFDSWGRLKSEALRVPGIPATNVDTSDDEAFALVPMGAQSVYTLDGAANWLNRSGARPLSATVSAANQLSQVDGQAVVYDSDGNTLSDGRASYTWNAFGELSSVSRDGQTVTYDSDGLGRRSREVSGGEESILIWDGGRILGTTRNGDGNVSAQLRVVTRSEIPIALVDLASGTPTAFLHTGTDRSVFAVTGPDSSLLEGYAYSAYGESSMLDRDGASIATSASGNRFLYQGGLFSPGTETYYLLNRDYQPGRGRFLSPDPIGIAGGVNLYAYVGGRPIAFADVDGLGASRIAGLRSASVDPVQQYADQFASPNPDGTSSVLRLPPSTTLKKALRVAAAATAYYKDLLSAGVWRLFQWHAADSRAATHLIHNMFWAGEPLTVPREWVMRGYEGSYAPLVTRVVSEAVDMAKSAIASGRYTGAGYVERTEHAATDMEGDYLNGIEKMRAFDNFMGAGGADLTVKVSFEWALTGSGFKLELVNVTGAFHDIYQWVADQNPLEFQAQSLGWYTRFEITGEWSDPVGPPLRIEHPAPPH